MKRFASRAVVAAGFVTLALLAPYQGAVSGQEGFRFKSGVELINVTVSVTDRSGRFVSGLRQEDFVVYEDDKPVEVSRKSNRRARPSSISFRHCPIPMTSSSCIASPPILSSCTTGPAIATRSRAACGA
jgi:hypothetical protein